MKDDVYCAAPFRHVSYTPWRGINPCCEWTDHPGFKVPSDDADPVNHPHMVQLRNDMLANKPNPGCQVCRDNERYGGTSDRAWYNSIYGRVDDTKLSYLEFNLGNLCNFKCRMCSSRDSSKWMSDDMALGRTVMPAIRRGLDDIKVDLSRLDRLKFKGGEPSLEQDAIVDILQHIDQVRGLANLTVSITTNGSMLFVPRLMALLDTCAQVQFNISIDGVGKINDYQRTGAVWSELESNLLYYQRTLAAHYELKIAVTWTLFNTNHAAGFMRWIAVNLPRYSVNNMLLYQPEQWSINNLPERIKHKITAELHAYSEHDHLPWVIHGKSLLRKRLADDADVSMDRIRCDIAQLDAIRGESLANIDPELYSAVHSV